VAARILTRCRICTCITFANVVVLRAGGVLSRRSRHHNCEDLVIPASVIIVTGVGRSVGRAAADSKYSICRRNSHDLTLALAVLLAVFLLLCGVLWYLFRPEKAFINTPVNEPPPPGGAGSICVDA
jgi:hypothetical protein